MTNQTAPDDLVERLRSVAAGCDDAMFMHAHTCLEAADLLDQLASTMSAEEVREAALAFIRQVQSELLSQDAILKKFNLDKLGRLLELLGQPAMPVTRP